MKDDEQIIIDLLLENEELRIALSDLIVNVMEDVPTEMMTEHLIAAINEAEDLMADMGDVDHKETEE